MSCCLGLRGGQETRSCFLNFGSIFLSQIHKQGLRMRRDQPKNGNETLSRFRFFVSEFSCMYGLTESPYGLIPPYSPPSTRASPPSSWTSLWVILPTFLPRNTPSSCTQKVFANHVGPFSRSPSPSVIPCPASVSGLSRRKIFSSLTTESYRHEKRYSVLYQFSSLRPINRIIH